MIMRKILLKILSFPSIFFFTMVLEELLMATVLGKYLKEATYYIKTGIGLSKQHYSHSTVSGVFGTGQGSVQSMYAWGMIVSCLIDLHNKLSHLFPLFPC